MKKVEVFIPLSDDELAELNNLKEKFKTAKMTVCLKPGVQINQRDELNFLRMFNAIKNKKQSVKGRVCRHGSKQGECFICGENI